MAAQEESIPSGIKSRYYIRPVAYAQENTAQPRRTHPQAFDRQAERATERSGMIANRSSSPRSPIIRTNVSSPPVISSIETLYSHSTPHIETTGAPRPFRAPSSQANSIMTSPHTFASHRSLGVRASEPRSLNLQLVNRSICDGKCRKRLHRTFNMLAAYLLATSTGGCGSVCCCCCCCDSRCNKNEHSEVGSRCSITGKTKEAK
jgi:hypothetical protein